MKKKKTESIFYFHKIIKQKLLCLGLAMIMSNYLNKKEEENYSLRPTFFVLFEKSNFLREHHILSCLPFKNVEVSKTTLKKIYQKIELVN